MNTLLSVNPYHVLIALHCIQVPALAYIAWRFHVMDRMLREHERGLACADELTASHQAALQKNALSIVPSNW